MVSTLIFETFLASASFKAYQHMVEYIEREVQIPTFLLNGESLDDFACAYADIGFVSSLSAFWLSYQKPAPVELLAMAVQSGVEHDATYPMFWNIVTRQEAGIQTVGDLEGRSWAYAVASPHIEDDVLDACQYLPLTIGKAVDVPSPGRAIRMLLAKKVDAIVIDASSVDLALHNSPHMAAHLRILGTYGVSQGPLVVAAVHLAPVLRQKIRAALVEIHTRLFLEPYLDELAIERFVPVPAMLPSALEKRSFQVASIQTEMGVSDRPILLV